MTTRRWLGRFLRLFKRSESPSNWDQQIDPCVIHLPTFPLEPHLEPTIAIPHPGRRHIPYPHPQGRLIPRDTAVAIARAMHRDHMARTSLTHLEADSHELHQLPALSGLYTCFRMTSWSLG
jgi:hypothetical protein